MLDQLWPSLKSPWARLDAAELTSALHDAAVAGINDEAADRSIDDLVAERDAGIIAILNEAILPSGSHRSPGGVEQLLGRLQGRGPAADGEAADRNERRDLWHVR